MGKKKNAGSISCSACRRLTDKPHLHDVLKVPVCEDCYAEYHNGEFELLEDSKNEKFCRWCGAVR
jgi:NMD protein affecting ribosome stability and mRNA decay